MTRDTASLPGSQRSVCRLPGSGTCTRHTSLNCTRVHRTGCLVGKGTSAGSGPRAASDAAQVAQYYGRQGGGEPGAYRQSPRKSWLSPGRWPPLPRRYAPTPRVAANAKRRGTRHVCDAEARVPEHVCGPCVRASAGSCVCAGDARARAHTHTRWCLCAEGFVDTFQALRRRRDWSHRKAGEPGAYRQSPRRSIERPGSRRSRTSLLRLSQDLRVGATRPIVVYSALLQISEDSPGLSLRVGTRPRIETRIGTLRHALTRVDTTSTCINKQETSSAERT